MSEFRELLKMKVVQLWVDPKTVFELDMEPKNSPLEPQKLKKKTN